MNNLFIVKKRINKRLEEMLDPNNFRIEELGCMYILYFHSIMYTCMDDLYMMVGTDGGGWLHGEQVQAG